MRIATLYTEFKATGLAAVVSKTNALHKVLLNTGVAIKAIGKASKIAFLGMSAAAGGAVFAAMKSEQSLAMVSTMLDKHTMHYLPAYRKGLRELSVSMGEAGSTLKKGLYDILSASVDPAKAMEVLAVASKAAVGGMTDTAVSADAITTVLNSYKLSAEKAADVSDMLFATVKRGKLTYGELASSIGKAAATSAIAGVRLEELLAAISTITRAGITSDQAMTSVVGTIRSFMKPTTEGAEIAKKLGFELSTATLRAEGLAGVFRKLNGLSAEQLAKIFPNIRGLKGVAAAMQDQEGFAKDLELQLNATGMAQEAFGKMAGTTSHKFNQMKQAVLGLVKDIGKELLPVFKELLQGLKEFVGSVSPKAIASVLKWGLALSAIGMILPKLIAGVKALGIAMLFLAANPIVLAIGVIVAALGGLVYAIYAVNKANEEANAKFKPKTQKENLESSRERDADNASRFSELTKINAKEKLTNKERKRALELAKLITAEYGLLGLAVDKASGKIVGMAKAEKRLSERQTKNRITRLNATMAEEFAAGRGGTAQWKGWLEERQRLEKSLEPKDAVFIPKATVAVKTLGGGDAATAESKAAYAKLFAGDMAAAEDSMAQQIQMKYGSAAAKNFGLIMAGKAMRERRDTALRTLEKMELAGQITWKERMEGEERVIERAGREGALLNLQAKMQGGKFGEGEATKVKFDSGSWKGLGDVWRDMQSAVLRRDPQQEELEKQTKYLEALPKILKKMGPGNNVALAG